MIIHQLQRTSKSKYIQKIVVAISKKKSDDTLYKTITKYGFEVFRESENNVLKRYYKCSKKNKLKKNDIIVRLTGDCPLHYYKIIDDAIKSFLQNKYDYLANCIKPIYPDGFDVEIFNYKALKLAYKNANKQYQKEHVTPYIRECDKLISKDINSKSHFPEYRLTVDRKEDFKLINIIFNNFNKTHFSFKKIIGFLQNNPKLLNINNHIKRNEHYKQT